MPNFKIYFNFRNFLVGSNLNFYNQFKNKYMGMVALYRHQIEQETLKFLVFITDIYLGHIAARPPSMEKRVPVVNLLKSLAKNAMAEATSEASPVRPKA